MNMERSPIGKDLQEDVENTEEQTFSEIAKFKELVVSTQRQNAESQYFVPQDILSDLMSAQLLKRVLSESKVERYRIDDLAHAILSGAQRTFAILILVGRPRSILTFVEDDHMQPHSLDKKLPLQIQKLLALLEDINAAADFYRQQWAFIAPIFNASLLPRVLERETVLPFTKSEGVGRGGFGEVYKIRIDPNHHSFPHSGEHTFILKELRPRSTTKFDYELEMRNLSTLKLLRHPCIIELLACFTYQGKHNLIFTLANGGSLAKLLYGERPSPFRNTEDILIALCGLSSGIRAVHSYVADDFEAIGCHHDLKPSNILVHSSKLLLADFGLSRFKEMDQDSASQFRGGRGDYLAPECEDLAGDFKKHTVGRSSDMWSFGCIISEIVTFMLQGAEGVLRFRSLRAFEIDNIMYYRFHRGPEIPHSAVEDWLEQLGQDECRHVHFLKKVIRMLLILRPENRWKIWQVDCRLRFISIDFLAEQIEALFEKLCYENKSILALIERQRFRSWRWSVETLATDDSSNDHSFLSAKNYTDFEAVVLALKALYQALQTTIPDSRTTQRRLFLPLRKCNDNLYDHLPSTSLESTRTHFECQLLLDSQNSVQLQELGEALPQQFGQADRIGQLAAVKRLKSLIDTSTSTDPATKPIDYNAIKRIGWVEDFFIGRMKNTREHRHTPNVLVETKHYDEHYSIESAAKELFARLEAIVRLLNNAPSLRVLHCRGYFHHPESYSLGLVYDFPKVQSPDLQKQLHASEASTLYEILKQDIKGQQRPLLGDRFLLAYRLASSLFEFHKVNWVQKAVSSFNIVFFRSSLASWKDSMDHPYFMGFLSSRQDDETCFTEGPTDDARHRAYLHPEYLKDRQRFLQHYDYYSLGLVLLELGLWRTLDYMNKGEGSQDSPESLRDALLTKDVPKLGRIMGAKYQSAVEECLCWRSQAPQPEPQSGECSSVVCLRFRDLVVEALGSCSA